ncbi:O-antigen ligase family protein [Synechococcus sp. Nb3U1]|uniref:O-antigen ligase family protein n=1 Tax=Synechococcus sp. Nb3U1 TaxID=1914529 RepID=UPI001F18BB46|nr:O-antigen ligase family protein [Synechococcus sp. Nb3U1]MCF2971262.1 O-antigen ligase family protein [Synechococcus sp. Nb3U1]
MASSAAVESSEGTQRIPPFWRQGWLLGAAALIPVNLAPSLLLVLLGIGRSYLRWGWEVFRDPLHRLALGLSLGVVAVALLGQDWQLSLPGMFNYWPFLLMMPVFARVLVGVVGRRRLAQVLVLGSWLMLLLGWGEVLWGWQGDLFLGPIWITGVAGGERPAAAFTSPNILAIYLVITLCLAAGLWLDQPRTGWRIWLGATLGLGSLLLILTASRNGWGAGALVLLLGLGLRRCWWGLGILIGLGSASLVAALDWPGWRAVVPRLLWSRLADTFDPQATYFSSTANRVDAWRFALEMVRERPLTGWGWQSFADLYNAQNPPELLGHCHNLYLHLAAEGGIPLLLGYLLLWGWILLQGLGAWRQSQEGVLLGILLALGALFASGLLDVVILDGRIHLMATLLLGAVLGASQERQGTAPETEATQMPRLDLP